MSKVTGVFTEILYMTVYGTEEQRKAIQYINERYEVDNYERIRQLLKFYDKDCMSRN